VVVNMTIDRPTLHESWHRVAGVVPRLRTSVQTGRQVIRGRVWHVLRDPASQKFFRVEEGGYRFVGLLDGRRSVDRAWQDAAALGGDDAPTQGEVIALLGRLHTANLLESGVPGDAAALFDRQRRRETQERRRTLANPLFLRIPLWDPDRFLDRALPLLGWMFSPVGFLLWLGLLGAAALALASRADGLWRQGQGVLAPENLPWLYLMMALVKLLHELGHGIAAKRFGRAEGAGGEVHTLGLMLLVLMPVPYVDASASWAFRSKWRRAAVAAAGMYVELAVAALAAIVWVNTAPGTLTGALAFNAIFVAGVSTLLFNANPLIRFDAYFILSDLTEQPNLMGRAQTRLLFLVKHHLYGVRRAHDPAGGTAEGVWLGGYGVASLVYRMVLAVGIILFVADQLFFLGMLLAALALVTMLLLPLGRGLHYLAASPELARTRPRAALATLLPLGLLAGFAGLVPVAEHGRAAGVVEPVAFLPVRAGADGFVRHLAPPGRTLRAGGPAPALLENRELETRVRRIRASLEELRLRRRMALAGEPALLHAVQAQVRAVEEELAEAEKRLSTLSAPAPMAGLWHRAAPDILPGRFVRRGTLLGLVVGRREGLRVRVAADQYLGPRLRMAAMADGAPLPVVLRVRGRPDLETTGTVTAILPGGQRTLPSPALSLTHGGPFRPAADAPSPAGAAEPWFEVRVRPGAADWLRPGQRVEARFTLADRPLLDQGWLALRQLWQQRFAP